MVMAPWNSPIPLTRGWCIFELYCTAITNSKFEVAMSQHHQDFFFEDMERDVDGEINKMLATIDAKNSECFKIIKRGTKSPRALTHMVTVTQIIRMKFALHLETINVGWTNSPT
jgi:hypothetical protein